MAIEQNNLYLLYALPRMNYLDAVQKTFSAEYIQVAARICENMALIRI